MTNLLKSPRPQNNHSVTKEISTQMISRFFMFCVLFTFFHIFFAFSCIILLGSFVWQPGLIYSILNFIAENFIFFFCLGWIGGIICIFAHSWRKTLRYIDAVVNASKFLISDQEEPISLPSQLYQIEYQMNAIKQEAIQNKRLAKEAEQRKNDLIVYLAHDLKTPLTSIIGYLTLLNEEKEISQPLQDKYLEIALNRSLRLEELINEFFDITRFNLASFELQTERVNLNRMLEQIAFEFKPIFETKGLQYTLDLDESMEISCDIDKMERVFDNLLRNAVNYSFEKSTIAIAAHQSETTTTISFTNHGRNIPKEKLNRLFEQFYRVDASRTSSTGGAGLGLAIAKEIIEHHHGTISATSENELITFTITLPNK